MSALPKLPLFILDTETTGFVPRTHRVIEFACAQITDGDKATEYNQLLSFEGEIPPHVQVLTEIKPEDLAGKPKFSEIVPTIQSKLTPDTIIVGQNIAFDLRMLKGEGLDLSQYECIDTAMLASIVFPELESYSLAYVSTVLGLSHEPKHRALGDVHATVEFLQRSTKRLRELPPDMLKEVQELAKRGPEGYRRFFAAIDSGASKKPVWLNSASASGKKTVVTPLTLPDAIAGEVTLLEEPLAPEFLSRIVDAALKTKKPTWISVKNLEATLRRVSIPESVSVVFSPELVLNPMAQSQFLVQPQFTADELTLAIKLSLYPVSTRADVPIHGDEQAVWNGKLATVRTDDAYRTQFAGTKGVRLIDHQELLRLVAEAQSPIARGDAIIIDDASMLEDTATHAYGWNCPIAALRASAEGNPLLTKCVDLLELWIERIRGGTDLRYLAPSDLGSKDAEGLRDCIEAALKSELLPQSRQALEHLQLILDSQNLAGRIVWTEVFQDGSRHLKSVPEDIASLLAQRLYNSYPTTLLIPPGGISLAAILPIGKSHKTTLIDDIVPIPIAFPAKITAANVLEAVEGKIVLLVGSKRVIEDIYIRHFHNLEEAGVTLICQGFAGGQNRMQAEFAAASAPAVLVTTPWMYETFELPEESVNRLVIQTLPFDHPSHAVIGRRAERYRDAFSEYSLPRLLHRLFRLLRTFGRHRSTDAIVEILDDRIATKGYGKDVMKFLARLSVAAQEKSTPPRGKAGQMPLL